MEQDKKVKLLKEIGDIKNKQEHIKKLMIENNEQKLNDYLERELTEKHFVKNVQSIGKNVIQYVLKCV